MPRINKSTVEFEVEGQTWVAQFAHHHGRFRHVPTGTRGKHITTCQLGVKRQLGYVAGEAICSLKDPYDWRVGLKLSLERALAMLGYDAQGIGREVYGKFMGSFYHEMENRKVEHAHAA